MSSEERAFWEQLLNELTALRQSCDRSIALVMSRYAPLDVYTDAASDPPLAADETLEAALRERAYRIPRRREGEIVPIGPIGAVEVWDEDD